MRRTAARRRLLTVDGVGLSSRGAEMSNDDDDDDDDEYSERGCETDGQDDRQ